MSIFGVSEGQVRLIIRDELLKQSANQQAPRQGSIESACKVGASEAVKCTHVRLVNGRSVRVPCTCIMSKQERYQEKLNLVRELSRALAIGERRLTNMEFELGSYNRNGYAISAMHHMCIAENIQRQSVENGKIHDRLHKVLDDLSKLNVI